MANHLREFKYALCKALGLDPHKVRELDIVLRANELPIVTVSFVPAHDADEAAAAEVRRYELKGREVA